MSETKNKFLNKIIQWQIDNLSHRQLLYVLSFFIGIISGLAALILKNAVHYTHLFVTSRLHIEGINLFYLAYPLIGVFLTVLFVRFLIKDEMGHGITKVLFSISKNNGNIKPHNSFSSIITSTLTIGFGGSVGLESPVVVTGSSIGSNLGRYFGMNYKSIITLIGCGAAGAIAGIFKAPIAAVIFGLEVLMLDLTMWSIIPLLISSVTGATLSYFFLGKGVILPFKLDMTFSLHNIPYYIILGILAGLISTYFTQITIYTESLYGRIRSPWIRMVTGGGILGILILFFPPLYGEGYDILNDILNGEIGELARGSFFDAVNHKTWVLLVFLTLVIMVKPVAMTATTGAGGVGGIFAPTLFIGGFLGFLISRLLNQFDFINLPERNFALAGMAGLMAGVMHAPLTAIFLIAEITGGYSMFIPLIITATIAYITNKYFVHHSIYTHRLALRGELITHHKDKAVLTLLEMNKVIEKDLVPVSADDSLGKLIKVISRSNRNIFPVVNRDHMLVGIVLLDNIRHIMFNTEMYNTVFVRDIMLLPPAHISPGEPMENVMKKFEENGAWNLPVIDNGKYVGFISKSKLFSVYRNWLIEISEE
ncbi:MAG: chloride channel protein [Bacteroidales bacterium]|nr:chloride channel protein [Bacteroidales bacterium]MBN2764603.1 chloride channel protein [Bacteroidales bacterium]